MEQIWTRIENELEDEGVGKVAISENKKLIYDWVEKALTAGDLDKKIPANKLQREWKLRTRSPGPNTEVTTRERLGGVNLRLDRDDSATKVYATVERVVPQSAIIVPVRSPSACSRRSQIGT